MASEAAVARITLTPWEDDLCSIVRARQPGIVIQSLEEERVLDSVIKVAQWMVERQVGKRELVVWSGVSSKRINVENPEDVGSVEHQEFFPLLREFMSGEADRGSFLILCDAGHELEAPTNVRILRECLNVIRGTLRTIIFIGKAGDIPDEVAADLTVLKYELPTAQDLENTLKPLVEQYQQTSHYKNIGVEIQDSALPPFARACAGLTEIEARGLFSLSISRFRGFDGRAVDMALKEKAQVVRRSNVLEYRTSKKNLDSIGGLENIKAWIHGYDSLFSQVDDAKAYGLRPASGLLLVGISGCGKSLTAECLAGHLRLPLLMLDVGKLFGSLVGQSEQNVDQMIGLAKACAPCLIFLDELDKGLGGSTGELDGGTSTRVKGKLLTWLQEKPDDVFVVATANDVKKFEQSPELIRAGRFDSVFFCDLPDLRTRIEILSIHLRAAGHNIPADDLVSPAKASRGYSGAELEVAVQNALRIAFNSTPRPLHPTSEMLVEGIKKQKPLSETMKEPIKRLRDWCKEGRAFPAGTTLEDDEASDGASLKDRGLPIVSAD